METYKITNLHQMKAVKTFYKIKNLQKKNSKFKRNKKLKPQ
jgi:hypothetical protein